MLEIVAPANPKAQTNQNANELSVMVRITYGARSFLFTGDATSKEEKEAVSVDPAPADILKVAHHGSKYSASDPFFAGLLPAAAVISAGVGNPYGHPNEETLEMLAKYDIKTLRTDQNGNIVFRTDGERIFVNTQK
jgi:beta-lactamase superfamily II metal-dependent hydrolase